MLTVGASLLARLQSSDRDLVDVFEFYTSGVTDLSPANAAKLYCETPVIWNGNTYTQAAISRGDIQRYMTEKFNSVTVTLSNVDRTVGQWIAGTTIEGYRLVIRCISRSVDDDSLVLFVGRCEKAYDVDNTTVSITAKQDLGTIENDLPWRVFGRQCPLEFKGVECLAGESLGSKSGTYQAATTCNKSHTQCASYSNTAAFQGFRFNSQSGNFKVSQRRGGAGGALLGLIGLGNKRVTKQWSSQDDAPYGKAVPLVFGRAQIEAIPVAHADTGEYVAGQSVLCEGPVISIDNARNVAPGFNTTFQAYDDHKGEYGPDSEQTPSGFMSGNGDRYSHTAYIEYTIKGNNPDTGDPAPQIIAQVMGMKIPVPNASYSAWTTAAWSDNPVAILRFLLTDSRALNYDADWIDDTVALDTARHCDEPLKDESGGEQLYLSDEMTSAAGTDFKRYGSTGVLNTDYYRYVLGLTATYSQQQQAAYNFYDPTSAPSSISASTYYRRRYTCSFTMNERTRIVDFIFKKLLPSFRGYLVTGADGKLQIRSERPQLTQYLRANASAGATALSIEDAAAWKALSVPTLYALVDVGTADAEAVQVSSVDYSTAGNSITLTTSVTGTITATASGATLSGGSTSAQASGTVTIGGTITAGNTCTITIDGQANQITIGSTDTTGTIAARLKDVINANSAINRYVVAEWAVGTPTVVTIKSKLGTLNLSAGLASGHSTLDEVMHIHAPFSGVALGPLTRGNVLKDSFKWPLGNKQTSYNQFVLVYQDALQDYQTIELRENDYSHQSTLNKINRLEIDGTCIDNYHQADRLVRATRYKYREGDFFCSWASAGVALLLTEGDVVCVNHGSMPTKVNLPLRLEGVLIEPDWQVGFTGRLYSSAQFLDSANPVTITLTTAVTWPTNGPGAPTSFTITQPVPGTARGAFTFANYVGHYVVKVEILKPGAGAYVDTGMRLEPDASGAGAFEIAGLPSGTSTIKLTPLNDGGVAGSTATQTIAILNPLSPRIEPGAIASGTTFYNPTVT